MMSNTHAPGPWGIEEALGEIPPNYVGISSPKHSLLALVVWKMEDDERTPSCEANARLIAAAPDLLAILQAIVAWADANPFERIGHVVEHVVPQARDAIAKATGA